MTLSERVWPRNSATGSFIDDHNAEFISRSSIREWKDRKGLTDKSRWDTLFRCRN